MKNPWYLYTLVTWMIYTIVHGKNKNYLKTCDEDEIQGKPQQISTFILWNK